MTISTSVMSFTRPRNSLTKTTASWTVLYIFQLPAMNGILIFLFAWGPTPTRLQDFRCRSASSVDSRPRAEGWGLTLHRPARLSLSLGLERRLSVSRGGLGPHPPQACKTYAVARPRA